MEKEIIMHCIHQPSRYLQAQNQISVDDCRYVRHSPSYKLVRCGSLQLCETIVLKIGTGIDTGTGNELFEPVSMNRI